VGVVVVAILGGGFGEFGLWLCCVLMCWRWFESMLVEFLAIRETLSVTPTTVGFTPLHLLTITSLCNSNIKSNECR
jgi:hypothetical protein